MADRDYHLYVDLGFNALSAIVVRASSPTAARAQAEEDNPGLTVLTPKEAGVTNG